MRVFSREGCYARTISLTAPGVRRRELLKGSLAAGATLSALPLARPSRLWGAPACPHDHRVVGTDVKHYGPNITFDYGSRVAALWLDR